MRYAGRQTHFCTITDNKRKKPNSKHLCIHGFVINNGGIRGGVCLEKNAGVVLLVCVLPGWVPGENNIFNWLAD